MKPHLLHKLESIMMSDKILLLKIQDYGIDTLMQLIEVYANNFIAIIQAILRENFSILLGTST